MDTLRRSLADDLRQLPLHRVHHPCLGQGPVLIGPPQHQNRIAPQCFGNVLHEEEMQDHDESDKDRPKDPFADRILCWHCHAR